jgi:D-alanyl-D-alanine carboxypeptidase
MPLLRKTSWALAVCLCVLGRALPCHAVAAALDPDQASRVDAAAEEWLASTDAPSVSLAIVQHGALVYAKAYGRSHLPDTDATAGSRYAVESLTKEFTATAVLLCAERRELSLDDKLNRWFPDLGAAGAVTLRQLLTHTSGIRDYWPQDFVTPEMSTAITPGAFVQEWVKRPLDFEPGTEWQYSNTNYVMAAMVVQRASGNDFFAFLRNNLFVPLGMAHVTERAAPLTEEDATGYTRYGLGSVRQAPQENADWLLGAANLVMRPSDLAAWDISLLDRSLLRAQSYAAQLKPTVLKNGRTMPYGLGLDIERVQGRLRVGHSGSGSGFLAENRIWPAERAAIIVFTNNDWASPADLLQQIAFVILTPSPAEARARAVFKSFQAGSIDRSLFSTIGNSYLSDSVLADLYSSLSPLGPARDIELDQESRRGGMITRHWLIRTRHARLEAVERGRPGKLDEFLVKRLD